MTEVKAKFRQLAQEYGLSRDQMLSVLIDIHDQCPECAAAQLTWSSGMGAARTACPDAGRAGTGIAAAAEDGGAMAQVDAALDMIRRAFRSMASDDTETASLREQLAKSRAEARKAEEAYRRKLRAVTERLRDLA